MRITAKFENVRSETSAPRPGPKAGSTDSVSPAARNIALARRIAELIDRGQIADYTAAARLLNVSQPRLTHLMSLLLLAPEIQAAILAGTIAPGDKQLRQLARLPEWPAQLELLAALPANGRARRAVACSRAPQLSADPMTTLPTTATERSPSDD